MGIARPTYHSAAPSPTDDTAIVEAIAAICEEFECYGWRRVRAALRQQRMFVNHKKIKRLMREHGLQPRIQRPTAITTSRSSQSGQRRDCRPTRPTVGRRHHLCRDRGRLRLRRRDPRRLVAPRRRLCDQSLDRRQADDRGPEIRNRATKAAAGCMHHSDRGSQYAAERYRHLLTVHGLVGSMGRRGNPYDNAKVESFMENHEGRGGLSHGIRNVRRPR
jgi:putative transposase